MNMTPTQTPGVRFFNGIPLSVPNTTYQGNGFYISYNDRDVRTYGDTTTALVLNQGEAFYILNGDHRDGYAPLLSLGFDACMDYFRRNLDQRNKFSDAPPAVTDSVIR